MPAVRFILISSWSLNSKRDAGAARCNGTRGILHDVGEKVAAPRLPSARTLRPGSVWREDVAAHRGMRSEWAQDTIVGPVACQLLIEKRFGYCLIASARRAERRLPRGVGDRRGGADAGNV